MRRTRLLIFLFAVIFIGKMQQMQKSQGQTAVVNVVAGNYALRVSHYRPQDGGTNCDSNCDYMASGDYTWSWSNGKDGVYASACDKGWPFGTRYTAFGYVFECRDRGGWIKCLNVGDYDKAIANAHNRGYLLDQPIRAQEPYCWTDMMIDASLVPYGTLVYDWGFVQ